MIWLKERILVFVVACGGGGGGEGRLGLRLWMRKSFDVESESGCKCICR
jgi:hypothetical protein